MSLKAVLFDVDGTLADTEALGHRPAYNRAFRNLGLDFRWGPRFNGNLFRKPGAREGTNHYFQHYRPGLGDGKSTGLTSSTKCAALMPTPPVKKNTQTAMINSHDSTTNNNNS